jgi:YidC/Oxa1 family membrane protein insertase
VPLGTHWLSGAGPVSAQGAVFLGVFVLLAGLCWLSSRLAKLMSGPPAAGIPAAGTGPLVRVLPYLTVVIAAFAPLAAGIYLLASTGWSLVERRLFLRRSGAGHGGDQGPQQPDRR